MGRIKAEEQESTVSFEKKLESGEEIDYKNRYIAEEIKRFLVAHNVQKQELYRRMDCPEDTMKAYFKNMFLPDGKVNPQARHMPPNIVFAAGMSLGLGRAEFTKLLDSAGYAPLKGYRLWRGDDIILKYLEKIQQCFSFDKNGEEARFDEDTFKKLAGEINGEFEERGLNATVPFRGK
jgi:hypothetical protein